MTTVIGAADLLKFHSGLKISDVKNWEQVPASAVVQPTALMKAEMAAGETRVQQQKTEYEARKAANPELYSPVTESNVMYEANVATLANSEIRPRIDYITKLIQSGEAAKYSFRAANGDQTTTSIHQFLFWLQQRSQELDDDGTYSPDIVLSR
ncbi:hypothetical protein [Rhizobium leguminosarum]|uniref:hypothetical protein n=1 Tax=Rhizobium leguminosarum TaxID=384 RepID=UPI0014420BDE|nr:hypothetical protein [Rhizobium leguminosarum]MBY5867276.1 hypothetical protein [Rhizobium leguminosarum]NKM05098.1 hypothetical protein [Rhizobium leguminosarum bv. viciae]